MSQVLEVGCEESLQRTKSGKCGSFCGMTYDTDYSGSGTSASEENNASVFWIWILAATYQSIWCHNSEDDF
jgi:hypothetical protein